jgi:hypothetical protein
MKIRAYRRAPRLLPLTAAACAACIALASGAWPASASTTGWRVVERTGSALYTFVMPTATSAWALGAKVGPNNSALPSGVRWNGHLWSGVSFPTAVKSGIGCSGASSATNVWAFAGSSLFGNSAAYAGALRLSGGKATVAKSFTPPGIVSGCSVLGPGNIWVYGVAHVAPGVGTWRLHGTTWSKVTTGTFSLVTASKVSATDMYALADGATGVGNVVAHWNGSTWSRVPGLGGTLPTQTSTTMWETTAINAVKPGNVWVAGEIFKGTTTSTFVRHLWDGQWHKAGPRNFGYYLATAVRDGHGGWWSTGIPFAQPVRSSPYLLHGTGGVWHKVSLPHATGTQTQIMQVIRVPGTSSMLAIAQVYNGQPALHSEVYAFGSLPS